MSAAHPDEAKLTGLRAGLPGACEQEKERSGDARVRRHGPDSYTNAEPRVE
jgi:hypothetical protein